MFYLTRCLPALLVALFLAGCATQVRDTSRTFDTVVIDAGHGGHDSGARSRKGALEKHAALSVALRLDAKLRQAGFKTVLTRRTDVFVPLDRRAGISNNARNAVFVSIHFNHTRNRRIHGVETYYRAPAAKQLARRIQRNLCTMASDRGVKTANYRVLRLARYPAVLVECGFMSHSKESARCTSPDYQERLADQIARALIDQRYH